MDYIIFGIGAGSSLLLIGWLLRDWGPPLRDRRSRSDNYVLSAHQMVDQMRWARFCGSCGTALAIGGALVLLATMIALLVSPSDDRGAVIVLAAFIVVSVGMVAWSWLFVRRFGIAGIIRRPLAVDSAPERDAGDGSLVDAGDGADPLARRGFRGFLPNPFASRKGGKPVEEPVAPAATRADDEPRIDSAAEPTGIEPEIPENREDGVAALESNEAVGSPKDEPTKIPSGEEPEPEALDSDKDSLAVDGQEPVDSAEPDDGVEEIGDEPADPVISERTPEIGPDPDRGANDGPLEPEGSDSTETVSTREEALRNLRQRRLERLTGRS